MPKAVDYNLLNAGLLIASASVFGPAIVALLLDDHFASRVFFYHGLLAILLSCFVVIANKGRRSSRGTSAPLIGILAAFLLAPAYFAVPLVAIAESVGPFTAYLEMVAAFTTTGGMTMPIPAPHADIIYYWRCQVGWMGGLVTWIAAMAFLRPLTFASLDTAPTIAPHRRVERSTRRHAEVLLTLYCGLTACACLILIANGAPPLAALCQAMAALSTHAVTSTITASMQAPNLVSEATLCVLMASSLTGVLVMHPPGYTMSRTLGRDVEIRLALGTILVLTIGLTLLNRDMILATATPEGLLDGLARIWGIVFTLISFLSTTGLDTPHPALAGPGMDISGLTTILIMLSLIGGGIASTAGGIKLSRLWDVLLRCRHEITRSVSPLAADPASYSGRCGGDLTWSAIMLFAAGIFLVTVGLSSLGIPFANAVTMTIGALSTTGPLITSAVDAAAPLTPLAQLVLGLAMIIGRLETILLTAVLWNAVRQ